MSYIYLFLQSCLLEFPVYWYVLAQLRPRLSAWERAAWIGLVNSVTHPMIFFGLMNARLPYIVNIGAAEAFAIVAEFLIFMFLFRVPTRPRPLAWLGTGCLLANLLSWQLAPMFTYAIFGP